METAEVLLQGANEATSCAVCPAFESGFCPGLGPATTDSQLKQRCQPAVHNVPARRPVCRAGEALNAIPILCRGWAASTTTLPDGRRLILSVLLPGDLLSSALIFEPEIRCSVEAITDVEYRTFDRGELNNLLQKKPQLFAKLSKILVEEKGRADQVALELGRCSADERIARLILSLVGRLTARGLVRDQTMDFPLRHHQIADAAGLTVVHVSKVMSEFRRAGLIQMDNRSMKISDMPGLRRIASMR